ncbi:hypothetical protein [Aquipseudomonas campi]
MNEAMEPIHPVHAALLMGKTPEPCEPFVEVSSKVLARLLDVVEFGDQLERVEKDNLLSSLKELLALEQPELWATHSPGPGEIHPCMTKEHAEREAKATIEVCEKMKADRIARGQSVEFWPKVVVDVIPSPFTPTEHFKLLAAEVAQAGAPDSVAVPEGYALVPARMELLPEDIATILFHCGGDEDATEVDEQFQGGVLWVGETRDDDGGTTYGLNIACIECLEEGSTPVVEFARPSAPAAPDMASLLRQHRIAVTPEHEGQWHADLYADEAEPLARAEGDTPEAAVAAVVALHLSQQEQEP